MRDKVRPIEPAEGREPHVSISRKQVQCMRRNRALLWPALFPIPLSESALRKEEGYL